MLPRQGEIDLKGFKTAIEFMGEAGVLKAPLPPVERFIDLQYLREQACSSGFAFVRRATGALSYERPLQERPLLSIITLEFRSKLVATERPFALGLERMPRCDVVRQQRQ